MKDLALRWSSYMLMRQMGTPTIWIVVMLMGPGLKAAIVSNLVGGLIFFWVDRFIITWRSKNAAQN